MSKRKNKILLILGSIFLLIFIIFMSLFFYFKDKFLFSSINGISLNGMTVEDAQSYINETYKDKKFIYIGKQKISYKDIIKLPIEIPKEFNKHFSHNTIFLELREDFFETVNKDRTTESKPANIEKKDGKLIMSPRIIGNKLDKEKLKTALENAINGGKDVFYENDFTNIVEDDTNYNEIEKKILTLKNKRFTIKFKGISDIEEVLDFSTIENFIDITKKDNTFEISFNKEKVLSYVKELDKEYRTLYKTYKYRSTDGDDIDITNNQGIGFDLDYDKSVDEIIKCLTEIKDEIILPLDKNISKLTSTYAEVNLEKQIMRIVKDGNVVLETSVVTGKDKTPTNKGIFLIYAKQRNKTLRGNNEDGSKYAVPVKYWLPFDGGIGIHDANRPSSDYVVSTYHQRGSHGCINTPKNIMNEVFEFLNVNMHVIVF